MLPAASDMWADLLQPPKVLLQCLVSDRKLAAHSECLNQGSQMYAWVATLGMLLAQNACEQSLVSALDVTDCESTCFGMFACMLVCAVISCCCNATAATASLAIHQDETREIINTALSESLVLTGEEEFVRFQG